MRKKLWILPTVGLVVLGEFLGWSYWKHPAQAAEPVLLSQRSTVSSEVLSVQPDDWAFTALRRLITEYGCLDGYAAWLFRGDRAITRYEFARGINVCLDVVIQSINQRDDFDTIRRLQEEFAAELSVLRG